MASDIYVKSGYVHAGELPELIVLSLEVEVSALDLANMTRQEVLAMFGAKLIGLGIKWLTSAH